MNTKHKNSLTDQEVVEEVLRGDTNAFGIIIKRTERLVAQIIFKMATDKEDRKDIAQDVYLRTYNGLKNFKFQSKLSTWIAKITYNACLNYLDKKKLESLPAIYNHHEPEDDAQEYTTSKALNRSANETERFIFQKELAEILQSEIEALPPLYKTLITLYHNEELSYSEIAQITELPEGTLKNYIFRARKTLKDNLLRKYKREAL